LRFVDHGSSATDVGEAVVGAAVVGAGDVTGVPTIISTACVTSSGTVGEYEAPE
jgi:hypothetical protein